MLDLGRDTVIHCPLGLWVPPSPLVLPPMIFTGCPYTCAAGYYGNATIQTDAKCSGKCDGGGEFCPDASAQPLLCPAGTYLPVGVTGLAETNCIPCAPGAYNPNKGGASCLTCPAGKVSEKLKSTVCNDCPSGGYCSAEGAASLRQTFTPCLTGTFNPDVGQNSSASCQACALGKANPIPGSSDPVDCRNCSAGFVAAASGAAFCDGCAAGKYQADEGEQSCETCGAGNYSANVLSCEPCRVGEYCPDGLERMPCPIGSTTEGNGAASYDDCGCRKGTFDTAEDEISCEPCPVGSDCKGSGEIVALLPLLPGYWRTDNGSSDLRRCPDASSPDTTACANTNGVLCKPWTTGPYCRLCNVTDGSRYFDSAQSACVRCGNTAATSLAVLVSITLAVLFLFCWCSVRQPCKRLRNLAYQALLKTRAPLKQMITFYQVPGSCDLCRPIAHSTPRSTDSFPPALRRSRRTSRAFSRSRCQHALLHCSGCLTSSS